MSSYRSGCSGEDGMLPPRAQLSSVEDVSAKALDQLIIRISFISKLPWERATLFIDSAYKI